jgi:Flp pilus assembly protein TadG
MRMGKIHRLVERARRDQSGSVAVIFGFSIFALFGFIGLAVDASRAYSVASRTQAILDTASLAAAKMLDVAGASDTEVVASATAFYRANLAGQKDITATFENLLVTPHRGSQTVAVSVDVVVPTIFAGVVGLPEFRFKRDSFVIYKTRGVELAMVLDITGSMDLLEAGGMKKIDAMKKAAKAVVAKMLDTSSGKLNTNRVALAPFSASVNVGPYRAQVAAGASLRNDSCVIERPGTAATSDDPISGGTRARVMRTPGYGEPGAPTDVLVSYAQYSCPTAAIQPLTNSASALNTSIDSYAANGGTAGHIGIAWGWNMISPNFSDVFNGASTPAAYTDDSTIKAVVMMTDGDMTTAYKTGDAPPLAAQAVESRTDLAALCTAMKAKGIVVYTVGFGLLSVPAAKRPDAIDAIKTCASDPSKFFDTETEVQLTAAFDVIATELSALRIM